MPLVVPQLRTITLGGAVTGLGIESTSFRNGLPHESVLEMDVFTGAGEVVTARPDNEHADLFAAFPNSYGSLGYATRLRIELEPVAPATSRCGTSASTTRRCSPRRSPRSSTPASGTASGSTASTASRFAPDELLPHRWPGGSRPTRPAAGPAPATTPASRSTTARSRSARPTCSRPTTTCGAGTPTGSGARAPFGAQHPLVRRVWPRRWRRSDVYHRLVGLDRRVGLMDRLDRRHGRPPRERVVQDVEIPVDRLPEFLAWFDREVGMRPVWLCPLRLRRDGAGAGRPTR